MFARHARIVHLARADLKRLPLQQELRPAYRESPRRRRCSAAQAACAEAAEARLRTVVWWDVDRDTGLDPYRTPLRRPPGVVAGDRGTALPMLAWWGQPPMPLVWAGIEHFGWA